MSRKTKMTSESVYRLSLETMMLMRDVPDSIPVSFYEKRLPAKSVLAKSFPEAAFFGWFVKVPDEFDDDDFIPQDLLAILKEASENGFEWVMLDEDEPVEDEDSADEERLFVLVSQNFDSGSLESKVFATQEEALLTMTDEIEKACENTDFADSFDEVRRKVVEDGETVCLESGVSILTRDELFVSPDGASLSFRGTIEARWNVSESDYPQKQKRLLN